MDWSLELVAVPVADVDRAKAFYVEQAGFHLDLDTTAGEGFRIVQLTPPGSACSILIGTGFDQAAPGSAQGLYLIVADIEVAHAELAGRGTAVSEIFHFEKGGRTSGPDPERGTYNSFVSFEDADGNAWLVQEVNRAV